MLPKINPTTTNAWQQLKEHSVKMKQVHLRNLFKEDADRFKQYSLQVQDILWDYSKNILTDKTLRLLLQLAEECKLRSAIDAMFNAEKINETEDRAVLHTALRNFSGKPVLLDGKDVMPDVHKVFEQMKVFCKKVHDGEWKGYSGKKIKYIVNI